MDEDSTNGDQPEERDLVAEAAPSGPGAVARARHALSQAVLVTLSILFAVFALANRQEVSFSWIVGETTVTTTDTGELVSGGVPLILLLVAAFVVGAVIGWTVHWRSSRRRRRRRAAA